MIDMDKDNVEFKIVNKRFRNNITGEIVTQFNILDIDKFEEIKEVGGCEDCGMAYSFYFNTQFHKKDCVRTRD